MLAGREVQCMHLAFAVNDLLSVHPIIMQPNSRACLNIAKGPRVGSHQLVNSHHTAEILWLEFPEWTGHYHNFRACHFEVLLSLQTADRG